MRGLRKVLQGSPRLVGVLFEFFASLCLARLLGVSATGFYSVALVSAGFVYSLLEGGANAVGMAAVHEDARRGAWGRKLVIAGGALAVGLIALLFHGLVALVALATAILALERRWGLMRRRKLVLAALTYVARPLAVIITAVILSGSTAPPVRSVSWVLMSALLASAVIAVLDAWQGGELRPRWGLRGYSGSLSLTTVLGLIPHVLLNALVFGLAGAAAAGLYAIALRPLQVIIAVLGFQRDLWMSSSADPALVLRDGRRTTLTVVAASVVAAGVLLWIRPLSWLFAVDTQVDSLAASAAAIVPSLWLATAVGAYLTRVGRYRSLIAPVVGLAVTTAVTGLALVPALGAPGAVIALILGEGCSAVLSLWATRSVHVSTSENSRRTIRRNAA